MGEKLINLRIVQSTEQSVPLQINSKTVARMNKFTHRVIPSVPEQEVRTSDNGEV